MNSGEHSAISGLGVVVIKPQSVVLVGGPGDQFEATVAQAAIRTDCSVLYEVIWWHKGERRTAWLSAWEVQPVGQDRSKELRIGFLR